MKEPKGCIHSEKTTKENLGEFLVKTEYGMVTENQRSCL